MANACVYQGSAYPRRRPSDAALTFYRDTPGFTVHNEVANGGFRWITLETDSQPEIQIVLSQPHAGRSLEDGNALAALLAKGDLRPLHFGSEDLDPTIEKVASAQDLSELSSRLNRGTSLSGVGTHNYADSTAIRVDHFSMNNCRLPAAETHLTPGLLFLK